MTRELREPTLAELEERTPHGQQEMAAARLMLRAATLLEQARDASGLTQKQLADSLGVSEGRISQVLSGDGNIRLSTFARYLRAMGYVPQIDAEPTEGLPPLRFNRPARRRRREASETNKAYIAQVKDRNGTPGVKVIVMSKGMPVNATEMHAPRFIGEVDLEGSNVSLRPEVSLRTDARVELEL